MQSSCRRLGEKLLLLGIQAPLRIPRRVASLCHELFLENVHSFGCHIILILLHGLPDAVQATHDIVHIEYSS